MSRRNVQLGQELCDQDQIIINLFNNEPVNYVGSDSEFKLRLNHSDSASNLVLILNQPQWCSEVVATLHTYLSESVNKFYIGVNRYTLLGNDTNRTINTSGHHGIDYVNFLETIVNEVGFCVTNSGTLDQDLGRYFNFVQPLTWIYGNKITNKSNRSE